MVPELLCRDKQRRIWRLEIGIQHRQQFPVGICAGIIYTLGVTENKTVFCRRKMYAPVSVKRNKRN